MPVIQSLRRWGGQDDHEFNDNLELYSKTLSHQIKSLMTDSKLNSILKN